MEKITITISPERRTEKPDGAEERSILSSINPIDLNSQELIQAINIIGNEGHSFFPATFELEHEGDFINTKSFRSSPMLVIDIDGGMYPSQALQKCQENGIECNCIYRTFRDETDPNLPDEEKLQQATKYRMIFVLDQYIHGADHYNYILKEVLYKLFPEADKRDAASIYFGGKDVIYCNPEYRLNPAYLINLIHTNETKHIGTIQARSRNFKKRIGKIPPQLLNEGVILAESSKTAHCNNIIIQCDTNEPLRRFDWAAARKKCKLLDDFLGCKRKIWHPELFGLYTAMKRIRGGKKKWRDAVKENLLIDNIKIVEVAKWIDDYEKKGGYICEAGLKTYAPDDQAAEKCKRLTEINAKRNQEAHLLEDHNHHFISLQDAQFGLNYLFTHALSKWDAPVIVLKIGTGVGKTHQYTICKHLDECIIAVPTHKLKDEISARLTKEGVEHYVIPKLPELPGLVRKEYQAYLDIGKFDLAAGFLRSLIKGDLSKYQLILDEASLFRFNLIKYFTGIDRATNDTLPIVTTHKRIMHTEFLNHSMLIVDEDILETIGEVKSISMKSIRLAIKNINDERLKTILQKFIDVSKDSNKSVSNYP